MNKLGTGIFRSLPKSRSTPWRQLASHADLQSSICSGQTQTSHWYRAENLRTIYPYAQSLLRDDWRLRFEVGYQDVDTGEITPYIFAPKLASFPDDIRVLIDMLFVCSVHGRNPEHCANIEIYAGTRLALAASHLWCGESAGGGQESSRKGALNVNVGLRDSDGSAAKGQDVAGRTVKT